MANKVKSGMAILGMLVLADNAHGQTAPMPMPMPTPMPMSAPMPVPMPVQGTACSAFFSATESDSGVSSANNNIPTPNPSAPLLATASFAPDYDFTFNFISDALAALPTGGGTITVSGKSSPYSVSISDPLLCVPDKTSKVQIGHDTKRILGSNPLMYNAIVNVVVKNQAGIPTYQGSYTYILEAGCTIGKGKGMTLGDVMFQINKVIRAEIMAHTCPTPTTPPANR